MLADGGYPMSPSAIDSKSATDIPMHPCRHVIADIFQGLVLPPALVLVKPDQILAVALVELRVRKDAVRR